MGREEDTKPQFSFLHDAYKDQVGRPQRETAKGELVQQSRWYQQQWLDRDAVSLTTFTLPQGQINCCMQESGQVLLHVFFLISENIHARINSSCRG